MMPRLTEVFVIREADDNLTKGLQLLDSMLKNPRYQLGLVIVNPSMFPGKEEWDFYEKNVEPVLKKNGWELQDEHTVIYNKQHWHDDMKTGSVRNQDDEGAWQSAAGAMKQFSPVSPEAQAISRSPEMMKKIIKNMSDDLSKIAAEFHLAGVGDMLNISAPGEKVKAPARVHHVIRKKTQTDPNKGMN